MKNKNVVRGLGAALFNKKSYLFLYSDDDAQRGTFTVRESDDGINFETLTSNAKVVNINGPSDDFDECSSFHVSRDGKMYYLTYRVCDTDKLCVARSTNLIDWEKISELDDYKGSGKIVSDYLYAARNVMFAGGNALNAYVSEDFVKWTRAKKSLITLEDETEDERIKRILDVVDVQVVDDGVFVMYGITISDEKHERYELYGALFDYGDPTKILWKSERAIYAVNNFEEKVRLFGAVVFDEYFVSYWTTDDDQMFLLRHYYKHEEGEFDDTDGEDQEVTEHPSVEEVFLERAEENPIVEPQCCSAWESNATYNPTAIEHNGTIHIIYRADGDNLLSVWGYAATEDGVTIKDRSDTCIYQRNAEPTRGSVVSTVPYTSGNNSAGGCEDPRAVLVDGVVYVTFTAFDGWGSVRVALTSIDLDDFINKRWNWKKTTLISPPGEMNKNWVIFPEKINGKFAILHSFSPKILIDYFDSLDELDGHTFIKSNNMRPVDESRGWDSWFRGVGPAPIKTSEGWLIFFHAMDHRNPDRYRLGALLLDLNDPTKELYRSKGPILEPEAHYENNGHKWGVIYCCGAVVKDGKVFVYYGGADKFVCVASAPLAQFLSDLKGSGEVRMAIN